MKRIKSLEVSFLSLLIVGVGFTITACSGDDVLSYPQEDMRSDLQEDRSIEPVEDSALNDAGQVAVERIIGKWRLTIVGDNEYAGSETCLTFTPDGKVKYEIAVNTDDYRYLESERGFENDWMTDSDNGLTGHIQFNMYNMANRSVDRFICSLSDTEMVLCPDMDMRYFKDPTMHFVKVE